MSLMKTLPIGTTLFVVGAPTDMNGCWKTDAAPNQLLQRTREASLDVRVTRF
jgi:hypothetical protein